MSLLIFGVCYFELWLQSLFLKREESPLEVETFAQACMLTVDDVEG